MLAFLHLLGPFRKLSLYHDCGEFSHSQFYVKVLLLLLNESESNDLLCFLDADEHSLCRLYSNACYRMISDLYAAKLVERKTVKCQEVSSGCTNKDMAVVIWSISQRADQTSRLKGLNHSHVFFDSVM